jgi:3-hydroxy acid dehydrogenase / malonic semialdehyde reductase
VGEVQHEVAHHVWWYALDEGRRIELQTVLGGADLCYEQPGLPHDAHACELFASTLSWAYWPVAGNPMQVERVMGARQFRRLLSGMLGVSPRLTLRRTAARARDSGRPASSLCAAGLEDKLPRVPELEGRTAVVTGASSGIGASTARALAGAGARLALGARRVERVEQLAAELPGESHFVGRLDVTDRRSCEEFVSQAASRLGRLDVLINNAGLALGRTTILEASEDDEREMLETNVLGLTRMTRLCLPHMEDGRGHIVNLGSWAGREAYAQGGMYVGSKYALRALTYVLRKELVGRVRVSTVDPGMVGDTEFSDVRFGGDVEKKAAVYRNVDYITPDEVADCILWVVTRPPHLVIDEMVIKPLQQASQDQIVRHE